MNAATLLGRPFALSLFAAVLAAGAVGCDRREDTAMENAGEKVKDGLDVRDNEKLKDTGENIGDATERTSERVKDAATPDK